MKQRLVAAFSRRISLVLGTVGVLALGACASDPPPEPVAMDVAALCSGSGSGDECVSEYGYCPASCGVCFQSAQQRIELKNLWMCDPGMGGGGGGGGLVKCATKSSDWKNTKDEARNQASDRASEACKLLVDIGVPCTEDVASASCAVHWWYGTHQCTARYCAQ